MAYSEILKKKVSDLLKAYSRLKECKEFHFDHIINVELSAKRFEYTYEVMWKTIKLFLLEEKGLECFSPMDCFKLAFQVGLIPENLELTFVQMVRKRNDIVHIYNDEVANEIYSSIVPGYIDAIGTVINNLIEAQGDTKANS